MRYVAAYCLAALGGTSPSVKDIQNILESAGIDFEEVRAQKVVNELSGKDLNAVIENGNNRLGSMPVMAAGGGGGAATIAASEAAPVEEKKEEKKEESEEESDEDMGFGLFD